METLLHLEGLPGPIRFCRNSAAVANALVLLLKGWPMCQAIAFTRIRRSFLQVRRAGDRYLIRRSDDGWVAHEESDVCAAATTIVEIVDAYVAHAPELGALHAGAAAFGGRMVLFPAIRRAGKSTLITRLAAAGHRIFADDLIPIDLASGEGVSTGCLPRPRIPFPLSIDADFAVFIERHIVLRDDRYAYVDPGRDRHACFGERLPIGAVVLLDRSAAPIEATIEPAAPDRVLWSLVTQETRRPRPAQEMLDSYLGLLGRIACLSLRYHDLEDAVACLEKAFAAWPAQATPASKPTEASALPAWSSDNLPVYRQSPHAVLRIVGDTGFLVDPRTDATHHLNTTGLAIWRMIGNDMAEEDIVAILRDAFPEVGPETLAADVRAAIAGMVASGLLVEAAAQSEASG